MPPEIKKTVNSMADMTCENCVYSHTNDPDDKDKKVCECQNMRSDSWLPTLDSFCNEGKWLCSLSRWAYQETTAPWITDYDECYYLFRRVK